MEHTGFHYNLKDLSERLNIDIRFLRDYIRQGVLNASKVGRSYRISSSDLDKFLEAGVVISRFGIGRG